MLNQSIFSNQLYGLLIKNLRQTHQLSLTDFSKKVYLNPSTISRLETTPNSSYDKYESIFTYFNIDRKFIDKAENELSSAFIQFMQAIIDISPDVTKCYLNLQNNFKEYKNSIFSFIFDLSDFIYSYFERNYTTLNYQPFLNSIDLLLDEYQAYVYIYIAQYLEFRKNMDEALKYFDKAKQKSQENKQVQAFYYYMISRYFLNKNNTIKSLIYAEKSTNLFLELQNFNRLINLNIRKGNQYRNIHNYTYALQIDLTTLSKINNFPHLNLEKKVLLNNIAWTYILMENYEDALKYLELIDSTKRSYNQYVEMVTCLIMLKKYDLALKICNEGLTITKGKKIDFEFLQWFKNYLQDKQSKKLLVKYRNIYENYKYQLSNLDATHFLKILMQFYIEQKSYKNAANIALEIMKLQNN